MPMTFNKFWNLLEDRKISVRDLVKSGAVTYGLLHKLRENNQGISLNSLFKLCNYLDCWPGDIMECVKEDSK